MEIKKAILVLIILLVSILGIYYIFSSNPSVTYENTTINGATLQIPNSTDTIMNQTEYYTIYSDNQHGINIYVFDNVSSMDKEDKKNILSIIESKQKDSHKEEHENHSYNYSDTHQEYTYSTSYNTKNIFI